MLWRFSINIFRTINIWIDRPPQTPNLRTPMKKGPCTQFANFLLLFSLIYFLC